MLYSRIWSTVECTMKGSSWPFLGVDHIRIDGDASGGEAFANFRAVPALRTGISERRASRSSRSEPTGSWPGVGATLKGDLRRAVVVVRRFVGRSAEHFGLDGARVLSA